VNVVNIVNVGAAGRRDKDAIITAKLESMRCRGAGLLIREPRKVAFIFEVFEVCE
jgi:hypothetical protein